jgi:hypothetical protein
LTPSNAPARIAWLLLLGLLLPSTLGAQAFRVEGLADDPAARVLAGILQRGNYLLLERDTLLGPDVAVARDVVVLQSRVTLEGRIEGSVAVVEGDFFVRPRAVVAGPIAVFGFGGAYVSGLAERGEIVYLDPRNSVATARDGESLVLTITEPPGPGVLRLPGVFGARLPTYDRVNALTVGWGAAAGFGGRDTATILLGGTARYRTGRGRLDGSLQADWRPGARTLVTALATRTTRTSESWIRGDLANTLAAIAVGSDVRDYYDTDEIALTLARTPPAPIIAGERFFAPLVTLRSSRDRSVSAGSPWSIFGGDWRPNPQIDDGVLTSVVLGASAGWRGDFSTFAGGTAIEWAPRDIGDFEFAQLSARGSFTTPVLWGHRLAVWGYALHPLGADGAPRQRWSFVGGPGTLPTLEAGAIRGDRLGFVSSAYLAPIPRLQLPLVGQPSIRLEHAAGVAWPTGMERPATVQNLGVGVQLFLVNVMVYADPAERPRRYVLTFGAQLPGTATLPIFDK